MTSSPRYADPSPQGSILFYSPSAGATGSNKIETSRTSPEMSPRKATPAQRAYLARRRRLTKRRQWLWKHRKPYMESIRKKATQEAADKKREANAWMLEEVGYWPRTMTPAQLDEHLLTMPYTKKGRKRRMSRASLVRRLRSLGLISYDPAGNTWSNLCPLPSE